VHDQQGATVLVPPSDVGLLLHQVARDLVPDLTGKLGFFIRLILDSVQEAGSNEVDSTILVAAENGDGTSTK
jgi:hypothetical protein